MSDWIATHRGSIQFVVWTVLGCVLLMIGLVASDPALLALGAGAIGLPGFQAVSKERNETP